MRAQPQAQGQGGLARWIAAVGDEEGEGREEGGFGPDRPHPAKWDILRPGWEAQGERAEGGTIVGRAGGEGRKANSAGCHPVPRFPISAPAHACGPRLSDNLQDHGTTTRCDDVGVEGGEGMCGGARALGGAGGGGGETQARPQLCHGTACRCPRRDTPARGSKAQAGAARRIGGGVAQREGNRCTVKRARCCRATGPPLDHKRPRLREAFTRTGWP